MWSDIAGWLALAVSAGALWYARNADKRSAITAERDDEQHLLNEVRFVAEFSKESSGEYEILLTNTGTKSAKYLRIDPSSIERFAVLKTVWPVAEPNVPLRFRYEKPIYGQLESIGLIWDGPGNGEQKVSIPTHRDD